MGPEPTEKIGWEVRNTEYADGHETRVQFTLERGVGADTETAAVCWDYDLACLIEAALNMRDGTVE